MMCRTSGAWAASRSSRTPSSSEGLGSSNAGRGGDGPHARRRVARIVRDGGPQRQFGGIRRRVASGELSEVREVVKYDAYRGPLTNCFLIVTTLVAADIGLSFLKQKMPRIERWLDGLPTNLVEDGRPLFDRMRRERIDLGDILEAAREGQALERMDQIKYAVLERNGKISIIPKPDKS